MGKFIDSNAVAYGDMEIGSRTSGEPDNFETVLPSTATQFTQEFLFGKSQSRLEAEITNDVELTIPDGGTLTVELNWYDEAEGTLVGSRVVNAFAPVGAAEVIAAGSVIGLVTPETDVEQVCKLSYTTSFDATAVKAEVKLYETA
jgi:hypothetical protein